MAHILVIDDRIEIRALTRTILEIAGHSVTVAEGGDAGLRQCARTTPDVVICDLFMPGRDGLETICELASSPLRPRILAISGGDAWHGLRLLPIATAMGADAFLAKPFSVSELVDSVAALLRKSRDGEASLTPEVGTRSCSRVANFAS